MSDTKNNNKLEDFVQNNREAFDDAIPNLKIWTEIEKGLNQTDCIEYQPKRRNLWRFSKIAAAVVFLLSLGGVIGNYIGQSQLDPNDASTELAKVEAFYKKRVSEKYAQLSKFNIDGSIDADLAQIDEVMEELREDMINQIPGTKEKIVDNLIKSYELKIKILEHVLERVDGHELEQNNNKNVQISL